MSDNTQAQAKAAQQKAAQQKAMQAKAQQQKAAQVKAQQQKPAPTQEQLQKMAQAKAAQAAGTAPAKAPAAAPKAPATGGNKLAKRGILKFDIPDDKALFSYFMPFVKGCGIFLPTEDEHKIGDEAFLLLTLPEGKGKYSTSAKVVWINPKQKLGKREPGIGLQISGRDADKMRSAIEEILGKKITSPLPTATM